MPEPVLVSSKDITPTGPTIGGMNILEPNLGQKKTVTPQLVGTRDITPSDGVGNGGSLLSRDNVIDFLRPILADVAGGAAGLATASSALVDGPVGLVAAPAAFAGAYGLTDRVLQH